jgi:hypothetical protein
MKSQQGAMAVLLAWVLPLLVAVAAYAVDVAYFFLVRNQLQNDADAAALAGARHLFDGMSAAPNWSAAEQKALASVGMNRAAGAPLTDATVRSGYWSLSDPSPVLKANTVSPHDYDAPAIEVRVSRSPGSNGGMIKTFFLNYFGKAEQTLQVRAVAGLASPAATRIFPGPKLDPKTSKPYVFQLTGTLGGWVDLSATSNSAGLVSDWLQATAPVLTSMGQAIWPQPGTMSRNYKDVSACSAAAKNPASRSCEYVYMPILSDVQARNSTPVLGFACMHILDAAQGQHYILAEMSTLCPVMPGEGVAAHYYGAKSSPALFK